MAQDSNETVYSIKSLLDIYLENAMRELHEGQEFRLTITVPKLSKMLGINVTKGYELVKSENFPSIKIGNRILVPILPLLAWLEKEAARPLIGYQHKSQKKDV